MEAIVKIRYGSHLYGTATPESDLDVKGIYIPTARDILLQRVSPVITEERIKNHGEKNSAHDIDYELYSPEKYLSLFAQGQSVALEMLFAPDDAMLQIPHPQWNKIKSLAPHILTKKSASFVNYCKQQAYKYCLKGARLVAARCTLEVLVEAESHYGASAKLSSALDALKKLASNNEFVSLSTIDPSSNNEPLYFEICGKKALLSASIKSACSMTQKIIDEYGQRALTAESCDGADWKALSHAVRVGHQAIEFLRNNHMTFPRPEAAHLLAIRKGKIAFQQVVEEIEQLVKEVEVAAECSKLPEVCDQDLIDDLIEQLYLEQVLKRNVHDI